MAGHLRAMAMATAVVCYKCDEPGHIATRCPYAAHQDAHQQQERPRPQQQQASRGTGTNSSQQGFVQLTMEQYDELRRNAEKAAALEEQCQKVQAQTQKKRSKQKQRRQERRASSQSDSEESMSSASAQAEQRARAPARQRAAAGVAAAAAAAADTEEDAAEQPAGAAAPSYAAAARNNRQRRQSAPAAIPPVVQEPADEVLDLPMGLVRVLQGARFKKTAVGGAVKAYIPPQQKQRLEQVYQVLFPDKDVVPARTTAIAEIVEALMARWDDIAQMG